MMELTTTTTAVNDSPISVLPDALLVSILSLFPTKTAVSTSVLSLRWKHLWTQLYHLSITGPSFSLIKTLEKFTPKLEAFLTTVDHVLRHLTSPKILKFELIIDLPWDQYDPLIHSWIRRACSLQPEDVSVVLHPLIFVHPIKIGAACIFQCNTIVSLKLGSNMIINDLPGYGNAIKINLPKLKKLVMALNVMQALGKLLTQLCKSCPLLEEIDLKLVFDKERHVIEIVCPNLKSFKLRAETSRATVELVIDAPKLKNLSIKSSNAWYHFVNRPHELAKVHFDFWDNELNRVEVDSIGQVYQALKGISSVGSLDLDGYVLRYIFRLQDGHLEYFHNLTELRIIDFYFGNLAGLMAFLSFCPNLEVLVLCMEDKRGYVDKNKFREVLEFEHPCLFTKLRVLELKDICGTNYDLDFVEYMLRNGSVLEKLLVGVSTSYSTLEAMVHEFDFCQKLFSYPRDSSDCEIRFSGRYITTTSEGFKHAVLECQILCSRCNSWN